METHSPGSLHARFSEEAFTPMPLKQFVQAPLKRLALSALPRTSLPEAMFRHKALRRVAVFAYHRILPLPGPEFPFDEELISSSPEQFEREVRFLQRNADVLSLREMLAALRAPKSLPQRPVLITFDDGYMDNYETAFPILKSLGLPATFFLASALVGRRVAPWWDAIACCVKRSTVEEIASPFGGADAPYRLDPRNRKASAKRFLERVKESPWTVAMAAVERLKLATGVVPEAFLTADPFLSWDQAREMAAAGMEIGGHTRTHPLLTRLDPGSLYSETTGCFEEITREMGRAPVAFAYPVGSARAMSAETDDAVKAAGFQLWFSHVHSLGSVLPSVSLPLPRLHAEYGDNMAAFRMGLARSPLLHAPTYHALA